MLPTFWGSDWIRQSKCCTHYFYFINHLRPLTDSPNKQILRSAVKVKFTILTLQQLTLQGVTQEAAHKTAPATATSYNSCVRDIDKAVLGLCVAPCAWRILLHKETKDSSLQVHWGRLILKTWIWMGCLHVILKWSHVVSNRSGNSRCSYANE